MADNTPMKRKRGPYKKYNITESKVPYTTKRRLQKKAILENELKTTTEEFLAQSSVNDVDYVELKFRESESDSQSQNDPSVHYHYELGEGSKGMDFVFNTRLRGILVRTYIRIP